MANKPKSLTVISDPLLDPYFITKDDNCYTVNKKIVSNKNHFRSTGKSKTYSKALTFHSKFDDALFRLSEERLHTKKETNLTGFINEYKNISNNLKQFLNEQA